MSYQRILLKLSGEALMGNQSYGIDPDRVRDYALEVKKATALGVQVAIVIGGGNIFRGMSGVATGIDRVQGDYMGMLATLINGLALQSAFENNGIPTRLITAIKMDKIAESFVKTKAIQYLEKGEVLIFSGGTGNPFFTTDTAAALRAAEIEAGAILKGTRVDGIYTADPEKNPEATKFETLTYAEAMAKNLKVMDMTAFALSRDNGLPIVVFDMNTPGNLVRLLKGEKIGTLVTD